VDRSLAGFGEAFAAAAEVATGAAAAPAVAVSAPQGVAEAGLDEIMALARSRLTDFQDAAYARRHADRVAQLVVIEGGAPEPAAARRVVVDAARELALWMAYEDLIRVADLKTRRSRLIRVRAEARAAAGDVVRISEHFSPGLDEIAAILPRRWGLALLRRFHGRAVVGTRGRGLRLTTSSVSGFVLLRLLALLRQWRPGSLRFAQEQASITEWWAALAWGLACHTGWASALAELPRLRKGYSDTHARGLRHFDEVMEACVRPLLAAQRPPTDADAQALREAIAARRTVAAATRPDPAMPQTVVWRPRPVQR
jgi:indolepyruvate ferredoxin oxidoreductase beta subunit